MILNVYKTELQKDPNMCLTNIALKVGNKTGICDRSVRNIIKEYKDSRFISPPKEIENRQNTFNSL